MGYGNEAVFLSLREREERIRSLLGKTMEVVIDRPIGYTHVTKGVTLHYTVNYGYLPGIPGGDGEEQDVYILGVREPLERFTGKIIAVIRRADDNEDKLVAAPEGMEFTRQEIEEATWFVEQYFDSTVAVFREQKKIFLFSFDDGTVWDGRLVQLLNKYGIKGTFNLNSGLEDFVWEFEGKPVFRQHLADTVEQYRGHEVASHTLHHPWLNSLTPPQLSREVGADCEALKALFNLPEIGFGVPFTACGEREIRIIRKYVRYIRLSEFAGSFDLPQDEYHIPIHSLYNAPDVLGKLRRFAECDLPVSLFVMAGHSYELEMLGHWEYLEELLRQIQNYGFESMTTMEFVNRYYPKKQEVTP